MKKYIIITADTNDGDYISEKHEIDNETLEIIAPVIEAIKNFRPYTVTNVGYDKKSTWTHRHNFSNSEYIRRDLGEMSAEEYYTSKGITKNQFATFYELVPNGEEGIHTIESIEVLEVENEYKLL